MTTPNASSVSPLSEGARPRLSIIIVSWNVRDLLRACLRSLLADIDAAGLDAEIIVVDSASADGAPQMVASEFPSVGLLAQSDNVGFARGNNLGLAVARGAYLLLLNPDTQVQPGAVSEMLSYMQEHPDVGLVGPQLLNPDGSHQSSRRRFPTLATFIWESTWLQPYAPRAVLRRYYAQDLPDDAVNDVDWVSGAAMLTRRAVVEQVGGLDEGYFMYSEELDWGRRIRLAGWRVVYLPSARIIHHVGKSSEQAVTQRHINFNRARLRYIRKFHGRPAYLMIRACLWLNYVWQSGVEGVKWLLGHRRDLRAQRLRAYWQVLRTGLPAADHPHT